MSRLILVRHAQASFFADNYDQLSPLGEFQAGALGEHWSRLGIEFDEVIVGPRERQGRTEQIVGAVYRAKGTPWPNAEVRPEFDEHSVAQLLGEPLEELLHLHPALRPLAADYRNAVDREQILGSFQRLFEAVCRLWCAGAPGTEAVESWSNFDVRVKSGLRRMLDHPGRNRTIAVFTSVGNITAALGYAVGCSPAQALELGWRLRNSSVTELIFSKNRTTLDHFNGLAHLTDPSTWTFR